MTVEYISNLFLSPLNQNIEQDKTNSSDINVNDLGHLPEWDLTDLYPGTQSKALNDDIEYASSLAQDFQKKYQNNLLELAKRPQSSDFADTILLYEKLQDILGRVASYAYLVYASDISHADNIKFFGDIQETLTSVSSKLLFFSLEINQIPDDLIQKCLENPNLAKYKPWFDDLRKEKPFQLEANIEKLFNDKTVTGRMAWSRLFNDTIASFKFDIDGQKFTLEPTLNLLLDNQEEKRKTASNALSKVFSENIQTFTLITNTLAKDKEISDRWRGFEDVADARHLSNRVERDVVDALVASVRSKYPDISHRYYTLKAKWMGKDKLAHWDRNAPFMKTPTQTIQWDKAQSIVLGAYEAFSPALSEIVAKFFQGNWIDVPVRDGKAPGAFAHPTVPSAHPYILLNYLGKPRDVMTLAHELGHGVHQYLANAQGPLMAPTPLTLAETASVFGEMLTFKALLSEENDFEKRKALIASKVEDMINTVIRQIAFYSFERDIHTARLEGELTSEQISKIWMNVQRESLGPSVELDEGYSTFWCYIPHFIHSPFYVYAYAFGECLVNSLYAVYENSNEGFAEKYIEMLRAGGSKHHKDLLAPFQLDASDPKFWSMGLEVIERLIDNLEEMSD